MTPSPSPESEGGEPRRIAELWLAIQEFERREIERGRLPDRRRLAVNRLRGLFELAGAVALALNVAMFVVLANFIVFNMLLHVSLD